MFDNKEIITIPYKENNFKLEPFGEYGFIRVHLERGETPQELKDQSFTDTRVASIAVNNFIAKKTPELKKKD